MQQPRIGNGTARDGASFDRYFQLVDRAARFEASLRAFVVAVSAEDLDEIAAASPLASAPGERYANMRFVNR